VPKDMPDTGDDEQVADMVSAASAKQGWNI
jgi:hypothetical protein